MNMSKRQLRQKFIGYAVTYSRGQNDGPLDYAGSLIAIRYLLLVVIIKRSNLVPFKKGTFWVAGDKL